MFTTQSSICPATVYPSAADSTPRSHSTYRDSHHSGAGNVRSPKKDSLKQPAAILIGAAALVLTLIPTGTFEVAEGGAIAAMASGGAIACLVSERHHRFIPSPPVDAPRCKV